MKRFLSLMIVAALSMTMTAGCKKESGKIDLSVGLWPDETQADALAKKNEKKDSFMAENPDINIIPDTYAYDTKTFTMKAAANQLPNIYVTYYTEISQIIKSGYAADLTPALAKYGWDKAINPELLELCTVDGKVYGLPQSVYVQGLYINKKIFREAGLVNEDGSIKIPDTYNDVAEFSKIIKEKTGRSGYIIPTTNNCGGWHFLNIAWSYGTDFMQQKDGKWEATFDTESTKNALQWVKDLKWKYNAFVDDSLLDQQAIYKNFAANNAAMMFATPPLSTLVTKYGMNIDDIMVVKMPKGPEGRYSQMGGGIYVFSPNCTEEQIEAGFKWLAYNSYTPETSDETEKALREFYELSLSKNEIILDKDVFNVWVGGDRIKQINAIRKELTNVSSKDYESFYDMSDVTVNPEPPACAQELYAILDGCIQEVLTNKNADIAALVKEACKDFQTNHLDKME